MNTDDRTGAADTLEALRQRTSELNGRLLELLSERGRVVEEMRRVKERQGLPPFDPAREARMLDELVRHNPGPFPDAIVRRVFKEVFRASLDLLERKTAATLRVARAPGLPDVAVEAAGRTIGRGPIVVAGPCSVEDEEQVEVVARRLVALGVGFLRGGAYKPRTSPYAFQGLGEAGLRILADAGHRHGLATISEAVDTRTVETVARYVDVLQVGSRNMANYELLKEAASTGKPVLLKRGFGATLDEYLHAAEYLAAHGNERIVLCERGIRTFDRETRFTLDISAVPLLHGMCRLPVLVDVSHAAGRRDLLVPLARAALAAGADGVMIEVHPEPAVARSDSEQQLDLEQFEALHASLRDLLGRRTAEGPARVQPGSPRPERASAAMTGSA